MSDSFINRASRVAIAGRIGERLRPQGADDPTGHGKLRLTFGAFTSRAAQRSRLARSHTLDTRSEFVRMCCDRHDTDEPHFPMTFWAKRALDQWR
jgi:hypothetical protein